jgi:hypothetical protein
MGGVWGRLPYACTFLPYACNFSFCCRNAAIRMHLKSEIINKNRYLRAQKIASL